MADHRCQRCGSTDCSEEQINIDTLRVTCNSCGNTGTKYNPLPNAED